MADPRAARVQVITETITHLEVDTSGFCEHIRYWIKAERFLIYGQDREGTKGYRVQAAPKGSPGALVWKACPIDGIACDVEQD